MNKPVSQLDGLIEFIFQGFLDILAWILHPMQMSKLSYESLSRVITWWLGGESPDM